MPTRSSKTALQPSESKVSARPQRRERQIVRILALLRILAQQGTPTVHQLAAEFGTRRETIYRDLRVLQDSGYPIGGDDRGRLSHPRLMPSTVPEIRFSASEVNALLVAAARAQPALPTGESLQTAAIKLKALAQSHLEAVQLRMDETFEAWNFGAKDYRSHENHVALLVEAILRRCRCRVQYQKPSGLKPKTYDFDPYRLLFVGGGLYVVGQVPKHLGTATLAVERLLSLQLSTTEFEVDPSFDPQRCRSDAFGVSWLNPAIVVLRFCAEQASYLRERLWHPSQQLSDLADGRVQLTFRAGGPFEIRRWILGWGNAVEVVSPAQLRAEIRTICKSAAALY